MSIVTETNHQSNDPIVIDSIVDEGQPVAKRSRPGIRSKADTVRPHRCNTLICVLENPQNSANVGTVMRNINALGIGKLYVVDGNRVLPPTWQEMRKNRRLMETSASAIKWTYCRRFDTTAECLAYLAKNRVTSMATIPHVLGKENINI
jgi:tRNA (guanosine-2'-O-)-methyltransferase